MATATSKEHNRFQNGPHTISRIRELSLNNCTYGNIVKFHAFDVPYQSAFDINANAEYDVVRFHVREWYNTEMGTWCEEHTIGGMKLDTMKQVDFTGLKVIVYGKLDSIDEMFYKLKWSK